MPVDGTGTDEELTVPELKRKKDFESQLMAGCTTIGVLSVFTYFLSIWPFTVMAEYTWNGLIMILAYGTVPASILGAIAGRKLGYAGSTGYFGGALASAVFMHLRLQQTMLGNFTKDVPKPEYPDSVAIAVPLLWFVVAGIVAVAFCKRTAPEL